MKKRRILCLALTFCILFLCGFGFWNKTELTLDTEARRIYECCSADSVIRYFLANRDAAKEKYDEGYFRILGIIGEKSKNNKSFKIRATNIQNTMTINCKTSKKDIINCIGELAVGDKVNVYGKISVRIGGEVEISIDRVVVSDVEKVYNNIYALTQDDFEIDKSTMYKNTLGDGKIACYIPSEWKTVEKNINKENLGTIEGYQYNLNNISDYDDQEVVPECLFVTYFDNSQFLKKTSERGETEKIEESIIRNLLDISDTNADLSIKRKNSYYGAKYHYYQFLYDMLLKFLYLLELLIRLTLLLNLIQSFVIAFLRRNKVYHVDILILMKLMMHLILKKHPI